MGEVAVTPVYDANGVATHLIGMVYDITEREQLEGTLHHRENGWHFSSRSTMHSDRCAIRSRCRT